nr:hypothetical protein [Tanacetum cinerariifolium]
LAHVGAVAQQLAGHAREQLGGRRLAGQRAALDGAGHPPQERGQQRLRLGNAGIGYFEVAVVGNALGNQFLQIGVGKKLLPRPAGKASGIGRGAVAVEAAGSGVGTAVGVQNAAAAASQQQ